MIWVVEDSYVTDVATTPAFPTPYSLNPHTHTRHEHGILLLTTAEVGKNPARSNKIATQAGLSLVDLNLDPEQFLSKYE